MFDSLSYQPSSYPPLYHNYNTDVYLFSLVNFVFKVTFGQCVLGANIALRGLVRGQSIGLWNKLDLLLILFECNCLGIARKRVRCNPISIFIRWTLMLFICLHWWRRRWFIFNNWLFAFCTRSFRRRWRRWWWRTRTRTWRTLWLPSFSSNFRRLRWWTRKAFAL